MAIRSKPVAELISGHTKWIHLAVSKLFYARSIFFKAKCVARYQMNTRTILGRDLRLIAEPVTGIDPTISAITQGVDHAVCITTRIERPQHNLTLIALPIAVGIAKVPKIRNAEAETTIAIR